MKIPEKDLHIQRFDGGVNSDVSDKLMPHNQARKMLNCRPNSFGELGNVTNIEGNLLLPCELPEGQNIGLGTGSDEEGNKFFWFVWNEFDYHTIFMFDNLQNKVFRVMQSKTDSAGIDVLKFNKNDILHVDVVQNNLLYWVQEGNKARKLNYLKAMDKSTSGYGFNIIEDYITAYKKAPVESPKVEYFTDPTRQSNTCYGLLFKFCNDFVYDDGEISNTSEFSSVALPPNQSFLGVGDITYDNNGIKVSVSTGSALVKRIRLYVKINSLDWQVVVILDKEELQIPDNSTFVYSFYNDGSYTGAVQLKVLRPYSRLPRFPKLQAFVKKAMVYGNSPEGHGPVAIKASVEVTYEDLFLPAAVENKLNNPAINANEVSVNGERWAGIGVHVNHYNVETNFSIGPDVKAGNKYEIFGRNGRTDNYYFTHTASSADTATTIASYFKADLRGIGRSGLDDSDGITNESTDGSGVVSFHYWYLGSYRENKIVWTTAVNPVSFQSLKDNGLSINKIKSGSVRKYAFGYEDDDGRKELAYTSNALSVKTDFITITGELKRPVHTITINHTPPIWAKRWQLLRTPDPTDYIDILIQKVIDIKDASGAVKYLDLVVGSLFTYQGVHPNTILNYEFARGDRVTFIKNTTTNAVYTPFTEMEVLSYKDVTTEVINGNVSANGTANVTVSGTFNADNVGMYLRIADIERLIVGVGPGSVYVLDQPLAIGSTGTPDVRPSYTIIDRRGVVRIKKPQDITVEDNSLVQISKPQYNTSDQFYKIFKDFDQKFDIANYGTDARCHRGNVQDQNASQPAIVRVINGDCYVRNRELPTNNDVNGVQVTVSSVEDPNYSDFYESNLYSLGRSYPQYDGSGEKNFGSRLWFSNNYIEDTKINGLNDFDLADIADYNDAYGDIQRVKFVGSRLEAYKVLRCGWIGVLQRSIRSADGDGILTTTDKLLGEFEDYGWPGGIGNNPESLTWNKSFRFLASVNSGVFLRIGQDGCEPISDTYNYVKEAREILSAVGKYGLKIHGGCDSPNHEIIWSVPDYKKFIYNAGFTLGQWNTSTPYLPNGTVFEVVQQPAVGTVSYNSVTGNFEIIDTVEGESSFKYRPKFPNGSYGAVRNGCITTVKQLTGETSWERDEDTFYCLARETEWLEDEDTYYCLMENNVTPLGDFDYAVLRPEWFEGSGIDLDTFTYFTGTGTAYDGDPNESSRVNRVGYAQNPIPPASAGSPPANRIIPQGSANPYLNWATDNTSGAGVEAILIDFKKFVADFPSAPVPALAEFAVVWYNTRASGDIVLTLTTYKGGTMVFNDATKDFDHIGGLADPVNQVSFNINVTAVSNSALLLNAQKVARISFNKTTLTASLTLL
jgi:hypothetical protein